MSFQILALKYALDGLSRLSSEASPAKDRGKLALSAIIHLMQHNE
jgi:hypothetical protein